MSDNVRFDCSHDILIEAPAEDVLDYVSNPNTWPEWIAASHRIDSPDRPLAAGETFEERWHTSKGEVLLEWRVTERKHPTLWVAQTSTSFIGPIIVRYEVTETAGVSRYTRTVINPARPKAPTAEMVRRIDEEAATALANIKRAVEKRRSRNSGTRVPPLPLPSRS